MGKCCLDKFSKPLESSQVCKIRLYTKYHDDYNVIILGDARSKGWGELLWVIILLNNLYSLNLFKFNFLVAELLYIWSLNTPTTKIHSSHSVVPKFCPKFLGIWLVESQWPHQVPRDIARLYTHHKITELPYYVKPAPFSFPLKLPWIWLVGSIISYWIWSSK